MQKPELLAPAGDLEKLKMAIIYGADAVYLGGEQFGLRKASKNFTNDEIEEGIKFAHERGKKVYVTMNIIPHNDDLIGLEEYSEKLYNMGVDGVIVSDPGIFSVINRTVPQLPIHLSTQASVTNYETIMFWYNLGIRRIVLARELSLKEIEEIIKRAPKDLEIETFVHGAMCISYSGRCLLSNYMVGRDANRGDCAHPCRWKYYLMEEKRPGEYFPIVEGDKGTFIFNSKDLCMIQYIPQLVKAGIKSFKIEGRVKSSYYVATVVRSYRMAIDEFFKDPENYSFDEDWIKEIKKASHRDFTTGFYFGKPTEEDQVYTSSSYIRSYDFLGLVLEYDEDTKLATVEQRNRMFVGDEVEVFGPGKKHFTQKIYKMWDEEGNEIDVAPHPQQIIKIKMDSKVNKWDIIRKSREDDIYG
ncbi:MAG: U32 family peptidase [Tissierellia bacterium]|nr:U32 family peptidase [Tissierellia bacterium]